MTLLNSISRLFRGTRRNRSSRKTPIACAQLMEQRLLLTTLGEIAGKVFHDIANNGFDASDPVHEGVTVELFRDGGDGVFGGDDTSLGTQISNSTGDYAFIDLAEGTYYVEIDPPAGFILPDIASPTVVTITPEQAAGTRGLVIDDLSDPDAGQTVAADSNNPIASSAVDANVLGGERDIAVEWLNGPARVSFSSNDIPGLFVFDANFGTLGNGSWSYDGDDNDALTIDPTGLGGVDITNDGLDLGIIFRIGADNLVDLTFNIFTDADNASTITVGVPDTGGSALEDVYIPFSDFTTLPGATGPADFTNVGALEGVFLAPNPSTQVVSDFIISVRRTVINTPLATFEPITIGGSITNDANNDGVLGAGESGLPNVALTLFEDSNGNDQFDDGIDTVATTTVSGANGSYAFPEVAPGTYFTRIDPSNFEADNVLDGFLTSTVPAVDPDVNSLTDDNGRAQDNFIITDGLTVINGQEPTDDGDNDANTNLTVGFGVFQPVDIEITKTDNADPVIAGDGDGNLIYTITAANNGVGDATGVSVIDTDVLAANLPAGATFVSAVGSGATTFDTSTGIWDIGDLPSGETATLIITLTIDAGAANDLQISNTASLNSLNEAQLPGDMANDTDTQVTDIDRQVDISVTKTDNSDPIIAGSGAGNLVYSITTTNTGPSHATGVSVLDDDILAANLPAGVTFDSAFATVGTFDTATGLWTIGNLNSGETVTLTLTLTIDASAADDLQLSNTATLNTVNETDTVPGNDGDTISTDVDREVDIAITKIDNVDPVTANDIVGNLVYTITATNFGPSNASGVTVLDAEAIPSALPAGVTFVSAVGSNGTNFNLSLIHI